MLRPKEITLADLVKIINIENFTRSKLVLYLRHIGELRYNNEPGEYSKYVYDASKFRQPRRLRIHDARIEMFKREEIDKIKKWLLDRNL
jgi:diphthamide synthase (EF-2-diphthine--ammonia ligase)